MDHLADQRPHPPRSLPHLRLRHARLAGHMPRMRTHDMMRWVFNIFALLSFLLCVATVVLWVRSYSACDNYCGFDGPRDWFVVSQSGIVTISEHFTRHEQRGTANAWYTIEAAEIEFEDSAIIGISIKAEGMSTRRFPSTAPSTLFSNDVESYWEVCISHLWLAYIFAGLPILWCFSTYRRVRVKRRLKNNLCVACGYDLQGSEGTCPECGANRLQSH